MDFVPSIWMQRIARKAQTPTTMTDQLIRSMSGISIRAAEVMIRATRHATKTGAQITQEEKS